jgi:hypothetical protein
MVPTEHQIPTATKLARIAWLSKSDKTEKFQCLMHHLNVESLTACFNELDGSAEQSSGEGKDDIRT